MPLDLEDAELLLARARKHYEEFQDAVTVSRDGLLWSFRRQRMSDTSWRYTLNYHREQLPKLRPIVGDIANNVRHSLDQIAAALAKAELGAAKAELIRKRVRFPFPNNKGQVTFRLTDAPYEGASVGGTFEKAFEEVWASHRTFEYYFRVVRWISNNSKHWNLEVVNSETLAVQPIPLREGEKPIHIPKGHFIRKDSFSWEAGDTNGFYALARVQFNDFQPRPANNPMPPNPDSVFQCTMTLTRDLISKFKSV